jgi:hypothetical protein
MAWIFELSAECGLSESDARALAQHFGAWPCHVGRNDGSAWWCEVVPDGVGRSGVTSLEVAGGDDRGWPPVV